MAEAMGAGEVVSVEIREDMHLRAKDNVKKYNTKVNFDFYLGDALEVLPQIDGKFDIIFIDASKGHYLEFLELSLSKLNPGGLIISDNIFIQRNDCQSRMGGEAQKTIVKRMKNF